MRAPEKHSFDFAHRTAALAIVIASMLLSDIGRLIAASNRAAGVTRIELTCVDPQATGYGTFQSHNQKVVSNRRGIFMTHLRSRNEAYTAQGWRLSWSTNNGASFNTVYAATNATNPALLESDLHDSIYLVRPDFVDGHAYLYRFQARDNYREPLISRIPNGSAGKFAMILDASRQQLAYFAHNNTFHLVGLDGTVRAAFDLLASGKNGVLQYPLLSLDEDGTLHAAWTTQAHGRYLYWDIHYLQSPDGGRSWRSMNGAPQTLPVVADETGPSDRITLDDEFEVHTWLSSFLVRDGKAHFLYLAQSNPPRQHYVRYDLASARRELDLQPDFRGQELALRNLDGFFAARRQQPGTTIYCISKEATAPRLACLASDDQGSTWYDYAVSEPVHVPYSIGGCREISADDWIFGSFTDQQAPTTDPGGGSQVFFFKIKAGLARVRVVDRQWNGREGLVKFAEARGQPVKIRFRDGPNASWSDWMEFKMEMKVRRETMPSQFQLHSQLGVDSEVQSLH